MANPPMNAAQNAAVDAARPPRASDPPRASSPGRRVHQVPRKVIEQSWTRVLRRGVNPDHEFGPGLLGPDEVRRRRAESPLREVVPVLRAGLLPAADDARHIMIVADQEGRVLWREGCSPVLRRADEVGLALGADLSEEVAGTNGIGTPAVLRRPVQVFAAEHFVRSLTNLTCAGAPITDPRDGRLLGVVDVSGPHESLHPATLAWVESVAKLAEARLRETHLGSLQRLRAVAAPVLARLGGRAAVVDRDGWTAAVTGMPYVQRITLPKSAAAGAGWVPSLGPCALEPLDGGWLVRAVEPGGGRCGGARITLDLSLARRWSVTVSGGVGSWAQELSPRHAELLYLLAVCPAGRSAAELAEEVFGDPARTVTVRAELSRVRRYLGEFLEHRPYRFREDTEVDVVLPDEPRDLLPHSAAATVQRARAS
ncbi:GAF domain-containing protein [Streptomyces sp. NPDC004539]|uniref:GAF domain-containing protein n=1 Tax=Streptomyces sp. NPDC004539 TaxID=3154280 RepID=UPI00339F7B79